jgi:K+ transporter
MRRLVIYLVLILAAFAPTVIASRAAILGHSSVTPADVR